MMAIVLAATVLAAQAGTAATSAGVPTSEVPVLKAGIADCSAEFTVRDEAAKPVYAAIVHVRVRYGLWSVKRSDLEVGTNSDGRARIEGLPRKARPLVYDVSKDNRRATVEQDVATTCRATFDVVVR